MVKNNIKFESAQHVINEIRNMNVKGGSSFGQAAAWAYKLTCEQEEFDSKKSIISKFSDISNAMLTLKPTMATIYNTKELIYKTLANFDNNTNIEEIKEKIIELCDRIIKYSSAAVQKIGVYGGNIISNGDTIMMHSYSGTLMSIFRHAAEEGK